MCHGIVQGILRFYPLEINVGAIKTTIKSKFSLSLGYKILKNLCVLKYKIKLKLFSIIRFLKLSLKKFELSLFYWCILEKSPINLSKIKDKLDFNIFTF